MYRDANVDVQSDDATLMAANFSDEELERAAENDRPQALNTAFCTQWWICPGWTRAAGSGGASTKIGCRSAQASCRVRFPIAGNGTSFAALWLRCAS